MSDQPTTPKFYPGEWVVVSTRDYPEYNGHEFEVIAREWLPRGCQIDIKTNIPNPACWVYYESIDKPVWAEFNLRPKPYGKPFHEMIDELKKVPNDQDRSNRNSKSEPEKVS